MLDKNYTRYMLKVLQLNFNVGKCIQNFTPKRACTIKTTFDKSNVTHSLYKFKK